MSLQSIVRRSLIGLGLVALAGQAPAPSASAAPQAPAPSASPSPAASPAQAASPSPVAPGKDPLLEFVPREHVPADSAVSFPVDI
jgi:hypothetical protein